MKKVISFSLWGNNPKYTIGAIRNAELADNLYPGWICRFYVGSDVSEIILKQLSDLSNTEIITMSEPSNWTGMFWRFFACENSDIMLSRDTDSRLSTREVNAVNEWLSSDKDFHIMRDHPHHNALIMGGMWGCRGGLLSDIRKLINGYVKGDFWQVDQNFLRDVIYRKVQSDTFIHDSFFSYEKFAKKFPDKRIDKEFVGDVFDEHDVRHKEYLKYINE